MTILQTAAIAFLVTTVITVGIGFGLGTAVPELSTGSVPMNGMHGGTRVQLRALKLVDDKLAGGVLVRVGKDHAGGSYNMNHEW